MGSRLSVSMRRALFATVLLVSIGCASSPPRRPALAPPPAPPAIVTDSTYPEALRHFWLLTPQDAGRAALRERLVGHLLARTPDLSTKREGQYEAVVEHFAKVTELYTPQEIADGRLPAGLEPMARYLVEHGSPRGDEARVLSALLALRSIHPQDPSHDELYRKIRAWGFDSRAALGSPLERFEEGLVEVWEEHARLTPTPEVLATLSRLYLERRNALVSLFQSPERRMPLSAEVFEGVQRTAMSIAAAYLRHGDIASALSHLQAMGSAGGIEERLIEILELAREPGNDGSGALLDLSRAYLEDGQQDVSRALCLLGLRSEREDARFPQCLARVAATQNDFGGAMAWYAEAVRLMPEERGLYDEILEVLSSLMEQGLFGDDTAQTRAIATRAAEILEERMRRWPDAPPAVQPEELYLAIAVAEMNAGNAPEAESRLHKSLAAKETVAGLMQLGLLLERIGRPDEALERYRRALQLASADKQDNQPRRAEILERQGDALRLLGRTQDSAAVYQQALALWDDVLARQRGHRAGVAQLRRGVLLGRLGRRGDSIAAFERALELAPDMRETYATILAYLVVSEPDARFAHRVFRAAVNQLSLEPEWKVYFAMWLRTIAGRNGAPVDHDASDVLADMSEGEEWWARLSQFGAGKIGFEELLTSASSLGERTEAYFYEGARRLIGGDTAGAHAMFQRVLESNMVNFYEFAMAQELLAQAAIPKAATAPAPAPSAAAPPARAQSSAPAAAPSR